MHETEIMSHHLSIRPVYYTIAESTYEYSPWLSCFSIFDSVSSLCSVCSDIWRFCGFLQINQISNIMMARWLSSLGCYLSNCSDVGSNSSRVFKRFTLTSLQPHGMDICGPVPGFEQPVALDKPQTASLSNSQN